MVHCGGNTSCCEDGSSTPRYAIAERFRGITTTTSASTLSTHSGTSIGPTSLKDNLSTSVKAGIRVGVVLRAVALVLIVVFDVKAMRWRQHTDQKPF